MEPPYIHGEPTQAVATLVFDSDIPDNAVSVKAVSTWVCILGAFPFAAMGFIKYNGMTAEQFVWAWLKSEFLMPKKLMFLPDNLYYETVKPTIEAYEKGLTTVRKKQKGRTPKPKKSKKKKAKCSKEVNNAENS